MTEKQLVVALIESRTSTRPAWLPSKQWEENVREGEVISPERAKEIVSKIRSAPESQWGKVVGQILNIVTGIF